MYHMCDWNWIPNPQSKYSTKVVDIAPYTKKTYYSSGKDMSNEDLLTHQARYRNPDSTSSARIFSTRVRRAFGPRDSLIRRRCFLWDSNGKVHEYSIRKRSKYGREEAQHVMFEVRRVLTKLSRQSLLSQQRSCPWSGPIQRC